MSISSAPNGAPGSAEWSVIPTDLTGFVSAAEARIAGNSDRAADLLAVSAIYGPYGGRYLAGLDTAEHSLTGELPALGTNYRGPEYHRYYRPAVKEALTSVGLQLLEDVRVGADRLENPANFVSREAYLTDLDHHKNLCLTLFHAAQFAGRSRMLTPFETEVVDHLFGVARAATRSFYLGLLGHDDKRLAAELAERSPTQLPLDATKQAFIKTIPRDHFENQELDQPNVILQSSILAATEFPDTDRVVGISGGGTQYAITVQLMYELLNPDRSVGLGVVPISTHADETQGQTGRIGAWVEQQLAGFELNAQNVLICDDSSNSGLTLDLAVAAISVEAPASVHVSLAELDTMRAALKGAQRAEQPVTNFARPDLRTAVGSVPISTGSNPDVQLRRQRAIAEHDPFADEPIVVGQFDPSALDTAELAQFLSLFAETEAQLEDTYGQRNLRSLASALLRHLNVEPTAATNLLPTVVHALSEYPFTQAWQAQLSADAAPTAWIREETPAFIAELARAARSGAVGKAVLFGIGDSNYDLSPPWEGSEELQRRCRLSGLNQLLERVGLLDSPNFTTVLNPREYALTHATVPALLSASDSLVLVSESDSHRDLVTEAATRLGGKVQHIQLPVHGQPVELPVEQGGNVLVDLDALLDDKYRRYYQSRNAYGVLRSLGVI